MMECDVTLCGLACTLGESGICSGSRSDICVSQFCVLAYSQYVEQHVRLCTICPNLVCSSLEQEFSVYLGPLCMWDSVDIIFV